MAENTAMRNNALPYPVYGVPYVLVVPILDADGDPVTSAAGLDSEISLNGDTVADGGTEAEVGNGMYSIALTAANMTADIVSGVLKSSTAGSKDTPFVLYPRKLVSLRSGTAQGGAAGYIILDASAGANDDTWNGCLCVATIDSNIEARIINDYTGSNQRAAVTPNWNVTPDSDDTFAIYLPEGRRDPSADQQDIAQIVHGTTGTVWWVATDGNDSNDGLSPATAKLSPKTTIEAASANDLVIIGPGVFALGNNVIALPNDVIVRGKGMDVTRITSTAVLSVKGCIVQPGDNSEIEDMTIEGLNTGGGYTAQAPLGTISSVGQATFNNAIGRRLRLIADSDGLYLGPAAACSIILEDCITETNFDSIRNALSTITLRRCDIRASGPSAGGQNITQAVYCISGAIYLYDCNVHATNGGYALTAGLNVETAGTIEMHGGTIYAAGSAGVIRAIIQAGSGTAVVNGVEYDRSKTGGTVTDVSGLHTAIQTSPLANSIAQRIQAVDVLTEAGGDGDLAAIDVDVDAVIAYIDTEIGAIKAKTDNLPASPAAVGSAMVLSSAGLDNVVTEEGWNLRQSLTVMAAAFAGLLSGMEDGEPEFKGIGQDEDGITRIAAELDANSNRTEVTLTKPD